MFNISKMPVLILSSPRTGSSVLGFYLKQILGNNIEFFNEPHLDPSRMNYFTSYIQNSKEFILKVHGIDLLNYDRSLTKFLFTSADVYRIKMIRKNLVEQIASYYTALERNKTWAYQSPQLEKTEEKISVNVKQIKYCIKTVILINQKLQRMPIKFDEEICYEDLPEIYLPKFYKTPRPKNYQTLVNVINLYVNEMDWCS